MSKVLVVIVHEAGRGLEGDDGFGEPIGVDEKGGAEGGAVEGTGDFGAAVALEGHAAELSVGY